MSDPMQNDSGPDEVEWSQSAEAGDMSDLLGFDLSAAAEVDRSGLRALVNSALVSQRRLPMLDVVFDRTARLMTTSLRQLTDDNIEVTLDDISTTRFGDYMQGVVQPAVIGVVRAAPLNNYCLIAADGALVYSIVDLLLGGRRGAGFVSFDERGFTAIELGLAQRILALLVEDIGEAFRPVADGAFTLERLETTPRFAAIAQEASVCAQAKFRVRVEELGGRVSVLFPHAALEPVRKTLRQEFIGEAIGADEIWRGRLSAELSSASLDLSAVLAEKLVTIGALSTLKPGETMIFPSAAGGVVDLKAGEAVIGKARIGRSGEAVAVRLEASVARPPKIGGEAA